MDPSDGIHSRSTAREVQAATGYDWTEWNYFHKVAYAKGREFVLANRVSLTTWQDVSLGTRKAMLEDLNKHLEARRMRPISNEVWSWKCGQVIPKMIREVKKADALQEEHRSDSPELRNQEEAESSLLADNSTGDSSETGISTCPSSAEQSMHHSVVASPIQEVGSKAMKGSLGKSPRAADSQQRSEGISAPSNVPSTEASSSPSLQLPLIEQAGPSIDDRGQKEKVKLKGIKDLLRPNEEQNRPPPARSSIHDLLSH